MADGGPVAPVAAATPTYVLNNDLIGIKSPSFDWQGTNLPHQFRSFKRYSELFLSTPSYVNKSDEEKVNYIVLWLGPQGVEVFDNFSSITADDRKRPSAVWEAFSQYFEPKSNFRLARFQLRELTQRSDEPIDTYLTRLKVQAQRCNFDGAALEDNLVDQLIKGTAHVPVRKKLLDQDPRTLTLDKAIDLAHIYEATQSQMHQLSHVEKSIDALRINPKKRSKSRHSRPKAKQCFFCGGKQHNRSECPARHDTCRTCSKTGH